MFYQTRSETSTNLSITILAFTGGFLFVQRLSFFLSFRRCSWQQTSTWSKRERERERKKIHSATGISFARQYSSLTLSKTKDLFSTREHHTRFSITACRRMWNNHPETNTPRFHNFHAEVPREGRCRGPSDLNYPSCSDCQGVGWAANLIETRLVLLAQIVRVLGCWKETFAKNFANVEIWHAILFGRTSASWTFSPDHRRQTPPTDRPQGLHAATAEIWLNSPQCSRGYATQYSNVSAINIGNMALFFASLFVRTNSTRRPDVDQFAMPAWKIAQG